MHQWQCEVNGKCLGGLKKEDDLDFKYYYCLTYLLQIHCNVI